MLSAPQTRQHAQRVLLSVGKRAFNDLRVSSKGAAVSQGPPGRSATTGHTVTVFGATGFLGRYLVSKLAKSGTQVIIPYRDEDSSRHFRPMGDLGQIVPMEWDIRNPTQIAECLRHSDVVYNLASREYETKNFNFKSVNVEGAELIAKVAADHGVNRFVHVSHLNAAHDSKSRFYQTKAEGEEKVRDAFPEATIVRPSVMFGYEDRLLNNMALWPIWWKLNDMQTKTRPVHVMDVAQALANVVSIPRTLSSTYNLPGPSTLTYEYLLELVSSITYRPPSGAPTLPKAVATLASRLAQNVWWPALSPDEVERRYIDDADVPGDWDVFGIQPEEIEPLSITYLRRFRTAENYIRPVVFPESRANLPTTVPHSRMGL